MLGQSEPAATTPTTLYTVPASTNTVISSIFVCNKSAAAITFRIAMREDGDALVDKHYLYYDITLPSKDTFLVVAGICMNATDILEVYTSAVDVAFNAYGTEVTA
jgi:hypothetical protein